MMMQRLGAEDWGVKGRRTMSVGLGGWAYNPFSPVGQSEARSLFILLITPSQSGSPVCRLPFVDPHWPPSNFDSRLVFSIQRRPSVAVHRSVPSQNVDSRLGFSIKRRPPVAIHQRELILPPLKILILA